MSISFHLLLWFILLYESSSLITHVVMKVASKLYRQMRWNVSASCKHNTIQSKQSSVLRVQNRLEWHILRIQCIAIDPDFVYALCSNLMAFSIFFFFFKSLNNFRCSTCLFQQNIFYFDCVQRVLSSHSHEIRMFKLT